MKDVLWSAEHYTHGQNLKGVACMGADKIPLSQRNHAGAPAPPPPWPSCQHHLPGTASSGARTHHTCSDPTTPHIASTILSHGNRRQVYASAQRSCYVPGQRQKTHISDSSFFCLRLLASSISASSNSCNLELQIQEVTSLKARQRCSSY